MPVLGQKQKCPGSCGSSVSPSGADIASLPRHVRLVPTAEVGRSHNQLARKDDQPRRAISNFAERRTSFDKVDRTGPSLMTVSLRYAEINR
jgi:hypothetical protein